MKSSALRRILTVIVCGLMAASITSAQVTPSYNGETPAQRDVRMKWWREARFGMFIHWGLYAQAAGSWNGQRVDTHPLGEWIQFAAKIPAAEYAKLAEKFNPVKFDAEAIVKMAKNAGMKYIVITSKHHEGFAMYPSKASPFNIHDATPFQRDPLKELAAACKKHGLRLGFYYSQAFDWHEPNGVGNTWDFGPDEQKNIDLYLKTKCVPQVKEILSNYGKISILWFDVPVQMTKERAELFLPLLKLQPGIIINNRLGGGIQGDSETPEQFVPATGFKNRDWETCMTINDTWGYKSYDQNWKSSEMLVRNLIDIASKGGNFLLNIGPDSLGQVPEDITDRLQQVGEWMKVNSKAIYGTSPSPFKSLPWGRCTIKKAKSNTTLYLHVYDWPVDGKLLVPGLKNRVLGASLLHGGMKLATASSESGVVVSLPAKPTDPYSSTVVLRIAGKPVVENPVQQQNADGSLLLQADNAELVGNQIQVENVAGQSCIGFWTVSSDWLQWPFQAVKPGKYRLTAEVATTGETQIEVGIGNDKLTARIPNTGGYDKFQALELGNLQITATGKTALQVHAVAQNWSPVNLRHIKLTPVQ